VRLIDIARIVDGILYGKDDFLIKEILPPEDADTDDLTFIFKEGTKTRAKAVIAERRIRGKYCIVVRNCRKAMYKLLQGFARRVKRKEVSEFALIDKDVILPEFCVIEPYTIIKSGTRLGNGTFIGAGVYIEGDVEIGENCFIHPGVIIYKKTKIGNFAEINSHSVIGKEGFGYVKIKGYKRIRHIGGVVIGDFVEIGSNVTIDRGTIGNTIIDSGTKIDNLVHIAHNVRIGKNCLIMGQVGIAGSTKIGDNTILCGQVGVSDHLKIGDNVIVYAKSGVFKNLNSRVEYSGIPARPHKLFLRALARLYRKIDETEGLDNI